MLPQWLSRKEPTCNAGDMGLIPGLGRSPGRKAWQPTPVFLPGESHGWRSLAGDSPWGHKESDMTERLSPLEHTAVNGFETGQVDLGHFW